MRRRLRCWCIVWNKRGLIRHRRYCVRCFCWLFLLNCRHLRRRRWRRNKIRLRLWFWFRLRVWHWSQLWQRTWVRQLFVLFLNSNIACHWRVLVKSGARTITFRVPTCKSKTNFGRLHRHYLIQNAFIFDGFIFFYLHLCIVLISIIHKCYRINLSLVTSI